MTDLADLDPARTAFLLMDYQRGLLATLEPGPAVAARLGTGALRRLERRGLVAIEARAQRRRPATGRVGASRRRAVGGAGELVKRADRADA